MLSWGMYTTCRASLGRCGPICGQSVPQTSRAELAATRARIIGSASPNPAFSRDTRLAPEIFTQQPPRASNSSNASSPG
jgi:hypothetical protein